MSKTKMLKPTEAELKVLTVLWDKKSATVREVHDIISEKHPTAYTTTLKILQIMTEKGLVKRSGSNRKHIYSPKINRETAEKKFADDLIQLVFGGSASKLVMRILDSKPVNMDELSEIKQMIDKAERSVENKK